MGEGDWEGLANRECGEHRTTGGRAWCFADSEWCYPSQPCAGCELPGLRATVASLRQRVELAERVLDNHGLLIDRDAILGAVAALDAWSLNPDKDRAPTGEQSDE